MEGKMRTSRLRLLTLTGALFLVAVLAATAGGGTPLKGGKPAKATAKQKLQAIDLATYTTNRWIVQLKGAPLAGAGVVGIRTTNSAAGKTARLNASSSRSTAYVSRLRSAQRTFAHQLNRIVPAAKVQRSYQVVLNGLAVRMTNRQAAQVRKLKGVRSVFPDIPYLLNTYATPEQIGATSLWPQLGGEAN